MTFGLSTAALVGIGVGVAGVGGALISANAAKSAANTQANAAQAGINAQQQQFQQVQQMLQPYLQAGNGALSAQQNLLGLNGNQAQQSAIQNLQAQPYFQSQLAMGNNNILQNASATGGLRGGNTQGLLAGFAPNLLAQTIQQQYGNLGGITQLGQNSAAMTGNFGMGMANNVSNLLQQQGAANAGGDLAAGKAYSGIGSGLLQGLGAYNSVLNGTLFGGGTSTGLGAWNGGSIAGGGIQFGPAPSAGLSF